MKKIIVSAIFAASLIGYASAAEKGTSTNQMPPMLPPMMTTGSSTLDAQVKALRMDYESKIKALQQEYLAKLKTLIGDRMASSTQKLGHIIPIDDGKRVGGATGTMMRADGEKRGMMGSSTELKNGDRPETRGRDMLQNGKPEVEGASSSTVGGQLPNGNAWGFFRKFLGF